jgi:hypothetical protein
VETVDEAGFLDLLADRGIEPGGAAGDGRES